MSRATRPRLELSHRSMLPAPRAVEGSRNAKVRMSVDAATVRKIARLARIRIDEAEVAPLVGELSAILGWIEQLGEVDTAGVAPMTAVIPKSLAWRVDMVTDGDVRDAVLVNAPRHEYGFYAVPKVIE